MIYRIGLTQRVFEEATVEVMASSRERAEAIAMELVASGVVEWRFLEVDQSATTEIVSIDELPNEEPADDPQRG